MTLQSEHEPVDLPTTTVSELASFVERTKMALSEAGRPDLADLAHIRVEDSGAVSLSFTPAQRDGVPSVEALKAVDIDPAFARTSR